MSIKILGIKIADTNIHRATLWTLFVSTMKVKGYICFAPASTLVKCCEDESYKKVIEGATIVFPDGMSVVWAGRLLGANGIERICGIDFMDNFLSAGHNYKHFFFGNNSKELAFEMTKKYPSLKIAGCMTPANRFNGQIENYNVIEAINSSNADIIWVGLGSPKQDIWMANHRHLLDSTWLIGVGAAFDYLSGCKQRSPEWMRNCGLEWLYRLCKEPKRLWKRYLIGNIKFIYYLIKGDKNDNRSN